MADRADPQSCAGSADSNFLNLIQATLAAGPDHPDYAMAVSMYSNRLGMLGGGNTNANGNVASASSGPSLDTTSIDVMSSLRSLQAQNQDRAPSDSMFRNLDRLCPTQSIQDRLDALGSQSRDQNLLSLSRARALLNGASPFTSPTLRQDGLSNMGSTAVDFLSGKSSGSPADALLESWSRREALSNLAAAQQVRETMAQQQNNTAGIAGSLMENHTLSSLAAGGTFPFDEYTRNDLSQNSFPNAGSRLFNDQAALSGGMPFGRGSLQGSQAHLANLHVPAEMLYSSNQGLPGPASSMERNYQLDALLRQQNLAFQGMTSEAAKGASHFGGSMTWEELVAESVLAQPHLRGVVSDLHFAVIAQMNPCVLTHEDRVGLYKTREVGFAGMCCRHCGGVPGFGRYFPGSLTSLVNGNICKSIVKHLRDECRKCPARVRESIVKLQQQDQAEPFHYRRGSRRQFFSHVWVKIHEGTPRASEPLDCNSDGGVSPGEDDDNCGGTVAWDRLIADSEIVVMSDRHLVPDTIFAATAQTRPCKVTEEDKVGRCKDHKLGSMGLCCKHCGGKAGAFGRYFPSNLHTFAQVEVCKQIVKHITRKCHECPADIRNAILYLQEIEKNKPSKRFPSRMVFFRRVWHRFHYGELSDKAPGDSKADTGSSAGADTIAPEDIPWEVLVQGSQLVKLEDKGLIADSQFAAVAQMDRCQLTEDDKIGYNKDRDIGFVGMCCRYCKGRPGFGRYFPNTVRNFEKTSARDTLVSHVSLFCQHCPQDVRNSVLSLKRIESSRDGSATMKGLIYGSGKLFFRRVWGRLHSDEVLEDAKPAASTTQESEKTEDTKKLKGNGESHLVSRTCKGDSNDSVLSDNDSSDDKASNSAHSKAMKQRKRARDDRTTNSEKKPSACDSTNKSKPSSSSANQRSNASKMPFHSLREKPRGGAVFSM